MKEFELARKIGATLTDAKLKEAAAKALGVKADKVGRVEVVRRSIDARQDILYRYRIQAYRDNEPYEPYRVAPYQDVHDAQPVIVVGAGPAGMFAALKLLQLGLKPIVLERGKDVERRKVDMAKLSTQGVIDPDSNYCYGEGGAGAFSDGKLYTRSSKRGDIREVLLQLVNFGASKDILIDAHPHIGSDKLPGVIKAMRETILQCGGEVHFETRVTRLIVENGRVTGVETATGEHFDGPVILATGHSARDVYQMLYDSDITVEAKGIAVGVRLEHPQRIIDQIQYHSVLGRGEYLPAAEYNFVTQIDHRGVYSFCMCPGGFVVPAVSEPGGLVVNGMSPSNRGSHWANSGMVVEIHPEDLPDHFKQHGVLSMMKFQQDMERRAFAEAGNSLIAGAQRMKDFVDGKASRNIPPSSYLPGVQPSRLDQWMPRFVANRLRKGFAIFGKNARGFLTNDAIVIGVETRTSSPLRIPRDQELLHHVTLGGLYPCGEGAGYAGGIVSSAIDGERCAEALATQTWV